LLTGRHTKKQPQEYEDAQGCFTIGVGYVHIGAINSSPGAPKTNILVFPTGAYLAEKAPKAILGFWYHGLRHD
ncbi:MAG: hypothetical protein RI842_10480, partial [Schleiferiaceae bacterium]|nr:hypothetical protein [Schleiferiaceae bacterium]